MGLTSTRLPSVATAESAPTSSGIVTSEEPRPMLGTTRSVLFMPKAFAMSATFWGPISTTRLVVATFMDLANAFASVTHG